MQITNDYHMGRYSLNTMFVFWIKLWDEIDRQNIRFTFMHRLKVEIWVQLPRMHCKVTTVLKMVPNCWNFVRTNMSKNILEIKVRTLKNTVDGYQLVLIAFDFMP